MNHGENGASSCDQERMNLSGREDLGRGHFVMEGDREGFKATVRPEFVADVSDVIAHSGGTDAERIRDTRGALAQRQVLEYFSLASAQG